MIQAIIFDVAGVITSAEDEQMIQYSVRRYGVSRDILEPIYADCCKQYERGEIDEDRFTEIFFRRIKRQADKAFFKTKFSMKTPNHKIIGLVKALKEKHPVYYLTNEGKQYWQRVERKFGINDIVTKGFVSYQFGMRKPAKELFKMVLKKIKCRPDEAVFIDDSLKNVEAAREMGICGIQFIDAEHLRADLRQSGLAF
ncbi:MAG: HAD family phosphatase [archaeon]